MYRVPRYRTKSKTDDRAVFELIVNETNEQPE